MRSFIIIYLFLFSHLAFGKVDYAKALLSSFGSGCKASGTMTNSSINHTEAILGIIKSIQEDDECYGWATQIQSLVETSSSLTNPHGAYEVDKLSKEIERLELAVSIESDPTALTSLATALSEKKVSLMVLGKNSDERLWEQRTEVLNNFNSYMTAMNVSMQSNAYCVGKHPGLLMQIGGQIISLSGGLNAWGTVVGSGIFALGSATQMIIKAIKGNAFNSEINTLEESVLIEALLCSFEKISGQFCEAEGVSEKVDTFVNSDISIFSDNWVGLRIITNLPLYNSWISRVIAGSPSGNTAVASRRKEAIALRAAMDVAVEYMEAFFVEAKNLYDNTSDKGDQDNIKKQLINELTGTIYSFGRHDPGSEPQPNPYATVFLDDATCGPKIWFYTGEKYLSGAKISGENCTQYIKRVKGSITIPTMELIEKLRDKVNSEARDYVASKFRVVKEVDPELVLQEAEERGNNEATSPIETLREIELYLEKLIEKYEEAMLPYTAQIIQSTQTIIHDAILEYEKPMMSGDLKGVKDQAALRLEAIQSKLAPEMKDSYLSERMQKIVNFEIRQKLINDDLDQVIDELLLLSLSDDISTLRIYMDVDLYQVKQDARGAMRNSLENLDVLGEVFSKKISKILKHLKEKDDKYPGFDIYKQTIDNLCISALSVPDLGSLNYKLKGQARFFKLCKGRVLKSIFPKAKIELKFDEVVNMPLKDRVCSYHDFLEENYIYQIAGKHKSEL